VLGLDVHRDGVVHPLRGQPGHFRRERGAEEHRLAPVLRGAAVDDPPHVGDEPHVQHPVGLVDHEDFDLGEIDVLPLAEIQQAARGRHDHVHVLVAQDGALGLHVHPAVDRQGAQARVLAEVFGVAGDLHAQFARRGHDERARKALAAVGRRRLFQQLPEDRQQERGGLAGARLGAAADVGAVERERQRLGLDRGAIAELQVRQRVQQRFRQADQIEKTGFAFRGRHLVLRRIPRGFGLARPAGLFAMRMRMRRRMVLAALLARAAAPDFGLARDAFGALFKTGTARLFGMRLLGLGHRGRHRRHVLGLFLAAERGLDSLDEVHMGGILTRPPAPTRCKKNPRYAGGVNS